VTVRRAADIRQIRLFGLKDMTGAVRYPGLKSFP
jgi:hypothetical protein